MQGSLFLVDTSVWLEVLPAGRGTPAIHQRIDGLLSDDAVATAGMVLLELLGGAGSQGEWTCLKDLLSALHPLPVTPGHWLEAASMGFRLRRQGVNVPFTDLLIGAVAMEAGAVLLHRDRHFDHIASHLSLNVESYVAA